MCECVWYGEGRENGGKEVGMGGKEKVAGKRSEERGVGEGERV